MLAPRAGAITQLWNGCIIDTPFPLSQGPRLLLRSLVPEMKSTHSHIVAIRRQGVVEGHQLRFDGGGAGRSKFFASLKHGGPDKARRAAERAARALGLPKATERGGSEVGRVLRTSVTRVAGIRFEWTPRDSGPVLRVVATWTDRRGKSHHTSYSVQRNGLEGALDKAIVARTSCGAPMPDRAALLKRLRREFATKGRASV
jgi:hypothetical protein